MPPILDDLGPARITLSNLRGKNLRAMDRDGKSDPWLQIVAGPLVHEEVHTEVQHKNLNPEWKDLSFPLKMNNQDMIKWQLLMIVVRDHDLGKHDVGSEILGTTCIRLDEYVGAGEPRPFQVTIMSGKEHAGTLSGKLEVVFEKTGSIAKAREEGSCPSCNCA